MLHFEIVSWAAPPIPLIDNPTWKAPPRENEPKLAPRETNPNSAARLESVGASHAVDAIDSIRRRSYAEIVSNERAEVESKRGTSRDVVAVMNEVGSWLVEERLCLIEEVWENISATSKAIVLSEAHEQDLQRRLDAYRDDPKAGSPWEEVEARPRGNGRWTCPRSSIRGRVRRG